MSAPLIDRVPDGLRDGLRDGLPERATGGAVNGSDMRLFAEPGACMVPTPLASRQRRVLTDAEAAALTGAGRHNARQRAELRAEVGEALLAALADGVVAP
ncbi:hypothetical protein ACFWE5_03870 [Cellulosimicrobium funkei]|uniref:hypothetical protein n=1 Tax=Cellulosimicrobium funkei TaxID=264251 RepID=UPI00366226EB